MHFQARFWVTRFARTYPLSRLARSHRIGAVFLVCGITLEKWAVRFGQYVGRLCLASLSFSIRLGVIWRLDVKTNKEDEDKVLYAV